MSQTKQMEDKWQTILRESNVGVHMIPRFKKGDEKSSELMNLRLTDSIHLAKSIIGDLSTYLLESDVELAFEGFSFASSGDAVLQLAGYKYILMSELLYYVPIERMYTYSPLTIKSIAKCSKKGMKKKEMIDAFVNDKPECLLAEVMRKNPEKLKKKINWVEGIDDIVDSYWVVKTHEEKRKN